MTDTTQVISQVEMFIFLEAASRLTTRTSTSNARQLSNVLPTINLLIQIHFLKTLLSGHGSLFRFPKGTIFFHFGATNLLPESVVTAGCEMQSIWRSSSGRVAIEQSSLNLAVQLPLQFVVK